MQPVILLLQLSSKKLSFRYKSPSRREILTTRQYKYSKKKGVIGREKELPLFQLNYIPWNWRHVPAFPRDLIICGQAQPAPAWAEHEMLALQSPVAQLLPQGRRQSDTGRAKMEARKAHIPTSPMPSCLLFSKPDDCHLLQNVNSIVTPKTVNSPIRFYIPKGKKPSPFHISPRYSSFNIQRRPWPWTEVLVGLTQTAFS